MQHIFELFFLHAKRPWCIYSKKSVRKIWFSNQQPQNSSMCIIDTKWEIKTIRLIWKRPWLKTYFKVSLDLRWKFPKKVLIWFSNLSRTPDPCCWMASTCQMRCECQCAKISVRCLSLRPFHVLLPRTVPFPLVQQRCPQGVSRGAAPGRKENVQKHIQKEKKEKKRKKGSKREEKREKGQETDGRRIW